MALFAAPILYGSALGLEQLLEPWFDSLPSDNAWIFAATVVVAFLLPLAAFIIPCATVAWLGVALAGSRREARVTRLAVVSVVIAATLFALGDWMSGLYGYDPPYVLFFLGSAMQLVAVAMPFAALGWLAMAFRERFRS
jgi:hypothetical protein